VESHNALRRGSTQISGLFGLGLVNQAKRPQVQVLHVFAVLFLELHNEMIRSYGGDPARVLDDLAEMRYEELSIDGASAERRTILKMPICRLVAKRSSTP
jgi:hypothetical protein